MTWSDLSRRAVTVVLVALCIIAIPAIANARFTAKNVVSQQVGTDSMATPTSVSGVYQCRRGSSTETVTITIFSFTDNGPTGSTYTYRLTRGSTLADSAVTTSKLVQLEGSRSRDSASTTWTFIIQPKLRNWTAGTYTDTVVCPASGDKDGFI